MHSYQVWPPGGSNAGSLNLRYRQRPILIKTLRISLCRNHVFLYSDSIGSETGRSLQPRRPTLRIGRGAGSGSDDAQSRRSRSFEGSWLVYTPQRSDGTGCWSLCCHGRRRLMSSAVADVVADRRQRHRHCRAHHHHHHASLLKIINKTGSLFRGLGALRLFSLSLSLSLLLSSYAVYAPFTAIAHKCPLR